MEGDTVIDFFIFVLLVFVVSWFCGGISDHIRDIFNNPSGKLNELDQRIKNLEEKLK